MYRQSVIATAAQLTPYTHSSCLVSHRSPLSLPPSPYTSLNEHNSYNTVQYSAGHAAHSPFSGLNARCCSQLTAHCSLLPASPPLLLQHQMAQVGQPTKHSPRGPSFFSNCPGRRTSFRDLLVVGRHHSRPRVQYLATRLEVAHIYTLTFVYLAMALLIIVPKPPHRHTTT